MSDKKIVYIPGWMDRAEYAGFAPGLDVWGSDVDYRTKIDADVIVAHSLGCHFALLNWQENKNTKLVLVNPLLGNKSLLFWFGAWVRFFFSEGINHADIKRLSLFLHFFSKLSFSAKLLKTDIDSVLLSIPVTDVFVVVGSNSSCFRDLESENKILMHSMEFKEIKNMGHVWKKEIIEPIVQEWVKKFEEK